MKIQAVHHVAIICSDYERSKEFYTSVLGFTVKHEAFREGRGSYKLDLEVNGHYQIELFSFPDPPARPTNPEACGLRHLAFGVDDVDAAHDHLSGLGLNPEPVRIDEYTGKKFLFFRDPDGLPLELYEG